jgi:hypothetical protein
LGNGLFFVEVAEDAEGMDDSRSTAFKAMPPFVDREVSLKARVPSVFFS